MLELFMGNKKYIIILVIIILGVLFYSINIGDKMNETLKLGESVRGSNSYFYNEDKTKIFYSYHGKTFLLGKNELENVDIESFIPLNDEYAHDKNNVYWKILSIKDADIDTFKLVGEGYSKDKNYVFFENNIVDKADSKTFKLGGRFQAEDKNFCYTNGKIEYSKKNDKWFTEETESLYAKIMLLTRKIKNNNDEIENLQDRRFVDSLIKQRDKVEKIIEKLNQDDILGPLLEKNTLFKAREIIRNNENIEKYKKDLLLANIYSFLYAVRKDEYRMNTEKYFKESIKEKKVYGNLYDYAKWLYLENKKESLDYYKDTINLTKDKEILDKLNFEYAISLKKFNKLEESKKIFLSLLNTKYKENSLIYLSDIFLLELNNIKSIEYYKEINTENIFDINVKIQYIKLNEKIADLYIEDKKYLEAKNHLINILGFYQELGSSKPYVFEEIGRVYKKLFIAYKELNDEKMHKHFELAMLIFKNLEKAFPGEFSDEVKELEKIKK